MMYPVDSRLCLIAAMTRKLCLGFLLFLVEVLPIWGRAPAGTWLVKPYRALVVVEHWNDAASVLVDHEKDEFQPVAALLKAWSVPFDILRLDQQDLDATYLFDRSGQIRYGVVIWLADLPDYSKHNLVSLEQVVRAGTSLLVVRSRFLDPALERVLGLKFKESYTATDPVRLTKAHFITRELVERKMEQLGTLGDYGTRFWVESQGADVLITQVQHPVLTAHQTPGEGSAVWLGATSLTSVRDSSYWRSLFFRALLWSLGYIVKPDVDFSRRIVMEMDDWGTSDKGFLSYWRYPIPDEETIRTRLMAPLEKRHAVAIANVITGYVDRKTRRIISPWTQKFTDVYGVQQDYAGTQRGLKAAVAAGVLEIQSHGWTHMQPDLESPPGPWWTADLAGEASVGRWYTEFEDQRRETEVSAIVQRLHMGRSLEYLREDFGQRPLSLRPGGAGWSKSYTNHTGRLAAEMGFGLFHAEPSFYCYLDRELVLDMTGIGPQASCGFERPFQFESWPHHPDGPVVLTFHDRDIALQPGFLEKLFAALPANLETQSMNQYVGFLHTRIESSSGDDWQLAFTFEEPYCAYFGIHSSSWRLWLADSLRDELKARRVEVSVDDKISGALKAVDLAGETVALTIPAGMGRHVWKVTPGH